MWLISAAVLLTVFALFSVLPVPLWAGRALRGAKPQLALPPAAWAELQRLRATAPALAELVALARSVRDAVADVNVASRDYQVARPWVVAGSRVSSQGETWANDVATELERRLSEATRLAFEWLNEVERLPPPELDRVERLGVFPATLRAILVDGATTAVSTVSRSLRGVGKEVARLQEIAERLREFEAKLVEEGDRVYR
ncbi:MAG: hypothetical protein AAF721_18245 [Myxococcota bacterium]